MDETPPNSKKQKQHIVKRCNSPLHRESRKEENEENGRKNATERHDIANLFAYVKNLLYLCSRKDLIL